MLSSMRQGIFSGVFLAILVLGGFGLMLSDWGGFFKNGMGRANVATIDGHPIPAEEFDRILRQNLQSQNISPKNAHSAGMVERILRNEITSRLLRKAAYDYGIIASDDIVAARLRKMLQPFTLPGSNEKDTLEKLLKAQNMREKDFVEAFRHDLSTGLLRDTIGNGVYVPRNMAKAFYEWNMENRAISLIRIPDTVVSVKPPADEVLTRYYDSVKADYSLPESRAITIGILDPKIMNKKFDITDEQARRFYADHKTSYAVSAKRSIEQTVLKTEQEALAIVSEARKDKNLKRASEKLNVKSYSKPASFEKDALPGELGEKVFAAVINDISDPVRTTLGWHVFSVKEDVPASTRSFDDVRAEIVKELAENAKSEGVYEIANSVEDRLAGGDKLQDMAVDFQISVREIADLQKDRFPAEMKDLQENWKLIVDTAFGTAEGEASSLAELSDGRLFTVQVDAITQAKAKPLKDVRTDVLKKWEKRERRRVLLTKALDLTQALDTKKTTFEKTASDYKVKIGKADIVRGSPPPSGLNAGQTAQIMAADRQKILALPGSADIALIRIDSVEPPKTVPNKNEISNIEKNLEMDIREERFVSLINHVERSAKVEINTDLLDRLYGAEAAE